MTKVIDTSTTSSIINRRSLLRGGSLATAALASPAAAQALPAVAARSPAGRRVLELVAKQRALGPMWDTDEDAASARSAKLCNAIETIGKSITARQIASVSDIVDRAILAAWACQPHDGRLVSDDIEGLRGAYIVDVLALAGIRPERCNAEFVIA